MKRSKQDEKLRYKRYVRSKTILTRGLRDRIAGADYVNSSDNMLSNIKSTYKVCLLLVFLFILVFLSSLFSILALTSPVFPSIYLHTYQVPSHMAITNLFSGSPLLNIVFTSRFFQPKSECIQFFLLFLFAFFSSISSTLFVYLYFIYYMTRKI